MSGLKTYIASLPGLTDEELVTEARSAGSLLSRARKSGTKRAVANLEKMRVAIQAEKAGRASVKENPGESTVSSYAGKIARMTNSALRAENKKLKNMLRESAAPVRHFGTEGLLILKQMITATEKEMRGRSLIPNPCRPMKNPVRLAYKKTEPYDAILYEYEDGTWFFEVRDPGLGGTLVYDDHDGRSRAGAEREAIRVIKREFEENPKKKAKKKAGTPEIPADFPIKRLPPGPTPKRMLGGERQPSSVYGGKSLRVSGQTPASKSDNPKKKAKKKSKKKAKKKSKKKPMSTAGRGAIGAGIGALALGPIGAVGLGYAATKYKPVKAGENPPAGRRPRRNQPKMLPKTFPVPSGWKRFKRGDLTGEPYQHSEVFVSDNGEWIVWIVWPQYEYTEQDDLAIWYQKKAKWDEELRDTGEIWPGDPPMKGFDPDEYGGDWKKTIDAAIDWLNKLYSPTGKRKPLSGQTADALKHINRERARKRLQGPLDPVVSGWLDAEVITEAKRLGWKSNPRKKKAKKETLIGKSRRLWDDYVEKPTKKALKSVLDHLEDMEASSAKTVKAEWRRAKRAARTEAKRLRMKV